MEKIKVLQVGMGPMGIKIANFIRERNMLQTVAVVDNNPSLVGKSLSDLSETLSEKVYVQENIGDVVQWSNPNVAILSTVSKMDQIIILIETLLNERIHVVSTCEELSYPWEANPNLAARINSLAISRGVSVIGTGVNPGFLMDALPTFLTSVCQHVDSIEVTRYQDAAARRVPFQEKIGIGLNPEEFERKKNQGTLRHIGLRESMSFIARSIGWKLDHTEDLVSPVISKQAIGNESMNIRKGYAAGINQVGKAYVDGKLKIKLIFKASIGEKPYDEITINGIPKIRSRITCGIDGDIATSAITVNAAIQISCAKPGLRTMNDMPFINYRE